MRNTSRTTNRIRRRAAAAVMAGAIAGPLLVMGVASAHIDAQDSEAPSGGYFTTAFQVPHGCDGAPTTKIEIKMADGVTSVKGQPVAGWNLTETTRKVDPPIESESGTITETVDTVSWEGGPLPDDQFQLFGVTMKLPEGEPGTKLEFPIVQTCGTTTTRWIDATVDGQPEPEHPAPVITLTAAEGDHHGGEAGETAEASTTSATESTHDDDSSSNGLAIAGIVLGGLGLIVGGAALVRTSRTPTGTDA